MSNIKEIAKQFAIQAHKGQVRKNEPDKPMIMHPISVGMLLEEYGYDDNIVAAGYLHDVVEDTKYNIEEIEDNFGKDIANLVYGASEPDKSLSWEERKQHTINEVKNLSLRNKLVVCADKINNLGDLKLVFQKTGVRDFSRFNEGEEKQKWYYTSVYESLITNEDENTPIFKQLKSIIDEVFDIKRDDILKDIFEDETEYYNKLNKLHAQKEELIRLKNLCDLSKPFVIEFCGTPRTGKITVLNNLFDFFKKGGFSVELIKEITTSKYYKEVLFPTMEEESVEELSVAIIEESEKQIREALKRENDIILINRSLNDRAIWNYKKLVKNEISKQRYEEMTKKYSKISNELINMLVITYTDSKTCLKRDYLNSLALEERKFLNTKNIDEYNAAMIAINKKFDEIIETIYKIDTTDISLRDLSVNIAENIMPVLRKKYIKTFTKNNN